MTRGQRAIQWVGAIGVLCVAVGYALEAFRQRGTCDAGNPSPDTLGLSVVLILFAGGLLGLVGAVVGIASAVRHRGDLAGRVSALLPAVLSLMGAASLFLFVGGGAGDWFQNCGS